MMQLDTDSPDFVAAKTATYNKLKETAQAPALEANGLK
jgi:hypothetical protein